MGASRSRNLATAAGGMLVGGDTDIGEAGVERDSGSGRLSGEGCNGADGGVAGAGVAGVERGDANGCCESRLLRTVAMKPRNQHTAARSGLLKSGCACIT